MRRFEDPYGQIGSYKLGDPAGTGNTAGVLRSIGHDAAGRITSYSHTNNAASQASLNQFFAYDDLNRLSSATLGSSAIQYSYDLSGNRTRKIISGTAYSNTVSASSNKLIQTQDAGGAANIVYDAAGNVTGDGLNSYAYSDRGRLSSVTTAAGVVNYRYNAKEQRIYKSGPTALIPTGAAYYVYDESGKLLGEYDANNNPLYETIYLSMNANSRVEADLGASPVAVLKQSGSAANATLAVNIYNVYSDHINTPRVITRQSDEAIVWRWDAAESFGATAPDQNPGNLGTFIFNQRLPGQVFDAETGLFQNWNREYNPRIGRYMQSDPIGLAGGINTFADVDGDPLTGTDPTGLHRWGDAPAQSWYFSKGKPSEGDSFNPNRCEPVDSPNRCEANCLNKAIAGRRPFYSIIPRAISRVNATLAPMCQEWAQQKILACTIECTGK